MPRWNESDLRAYEKRQSDQAGGVASSPQPQRVVCDDPVGQAPRKENHPNRFKVSVTSRRRRLIDPDNLCPKYFIDALRYEGLIPDDSVKHIILEVRQEKSDIEQTVIEITALD